MKPSSGQSPGSCALSRRGFFVAANTLPWASCVGTVASCLKPRRMAVSPFRYEPDHAPCDAGTVWDQAKPLRLRGARHHGRA